MTMAQEWWQGAAANDLLSRRLMVARELVYAVTDHKGVSASALCAV